MRKSESHVFRLATPPIRCVVPEDIAPGVFDAFAWCESDWLDWRRPALSSAPGGRFDDETVLDGSDPHRMVFVFEPSAPRGLLPRELARLHAVGLGLEDEEALAPWGIDAATDELYAQRLRPRDVLWLAADNLNALFWGLHDWAHFHNHGPFEQRAWTELQCDASAMAWLWSNRVAVGLSERGWERLHAQAVEQALKRFDDEGVACDARALSADRVKALVQPEARAAE